MIRDLVTRTKTVIKKETKNGIGSVIVNMVDQVELREGMNLDLLDEIVETKVTSVDMMRSQVVADLYQHRDEIIMLDLLIDLLEAEAVMTEIIILQVGPVKFRKMIP